MAAKHLRATSVAPPTVTSREVVCMYVPSTVMYLHDRYRSVLADQDGVGMGTILL